MKAYSRAVRAASVAYAFTGLHQPQVISVIHPENAASVRVAERLGERMVGPTEVMGKTALVYKITRAEWETLHQPRNRESVRC